MKKHYNHFILIAAVLIFSQTANAKSIWWKDRVYNEDFALDSKSCLTNENTMNGWNACLISKGWKLVEGDRISSIIKMCTSKWKTNDKMDWTQYNECNKSNGVDMITSIQVQLPKAIGEYSVFCLKPEFSKIIKIAPCLPRDIKFEHLANQAVITDDEKPIFARWIAERTEIIKKTNQIRRTYGGLVAKRTADYYDNTVEPAFENIRLDVYNKKITWGEYNKGIKEISQNSLKETIRINEEINKYIEKISTENSEKISLIQKNQTEIDSQRNTNAANSNSQNNREAQCQFVRSQEYFKPVGGGFFQSMQNAESAFNNCMAGIPRITTNCTKDAFGQISCVSQ